MKKRILSMLLAIVMVVSMMPGFTLAASAADDSAKAIYVSETGTGTEDGSRENPYTTLQAAFDATKEGGNYEIILLSDITASDAVDQYDASYKRNEALKYRAAANVTLRSDNASTLYTIYRDCEEYVIRVAGNDKSNPLTFTLKDIILDGNSEKYNSDDKIYSLFLINYTNMYIESGTTLRNNVNTSSTGQGGAVSVQTGSSLVMNGGIIEYCKAYSGGALYSPASGIPMTINGGILRYNEATADTADTAETNAGGGGAIFTCGELTVNGGTFSNNKAVRGGAILSRNLYGTNVIFGNVIIENNTATKHGGAIHSAGNFTLSGGTIQNNHADSRAGGIFHSSGNGKLTLEGGNVSGNTEGANKTSSGVVDYRNYKQSSDTLSNISSGGYISSYVFTMVYMSNSFACADTIYTNRPLRFIEWDSARNNSYKIEPLETSNSLTVSSTHGSKLPSGNFLVFGNDESIQLDLSKFSSDGYTLIQKDTLERFIFYGAPLTAPTIALTLVNNELSYAITPVSAETGAVSGYEIQIYKEDGTAVGEPISVTELSGSIGIDAAGSYQAKVRAIDTKKNSSGYIVKDITKYCESDWSALSESVIIENSHEHNWTYTKENETTIKATCTNTDGNCSDANGGTVTIAASTNLTYTGNAIEAVVTNDLVDTTTEVNVVYTAKDGSTLTGDKPVNAGAYTATITLGDAEISVEYEIEKAPLTIMPKSYTMVIGNAVPDLTASDAYTVEGLMGSDTVNNIELRFVSEPDMSEEGTYTIEVNENTLSVTNGENYDINCSWGELKVVACVHSFTDFYLGTVNAENDSIFAKCSKAGCKFSNGKAIITIEAPTDAVYEKGQEHTASLLGHTDSIAVDSEDIIYSATPMDAGEYTASITCEGVTASVEYEVKKRELTVKADNRSVNAGESAPEYTYTVTGWGDNYDPEDEDAHKLSGITAVCADADLAKAGTYAISISGTPVVKKTDGTDVTKNYSVKLESGTLTVIPNTYAVTLNTNGGTINEGNVTSYVYGIGATLPTNVTRDGYTFDRWYEDASVTGNPVAYISATDSGDKTYWAKWTVNRYTITFDTDGGSAIDAITDYYGTVVTAPANPTKTGYTFVGWDKEIPATMPANDVTLTAQWTVNRYTVTWDNGNGGSYDKDFAYGETITVPTSEPFQDTFRKPGYTLTGWEGYTEGMTMPANALTFTAIYTPNKYTITFDTDGGSAVDAITQDYGTAVTAPANPTKTGYTFAGWDKEIPAAMPAENMTVKALWEEIPETASVIRLAGDTRYDTAIKAAYELKEKLGVEKFSTIIVTTGEQFADALAGSYLAAQKDAPILLVRNRDREMNQIKDYIKANLISGGTVYLLGGEAAVSKKMETGLDGFQVKRLGGKDRYATNLLILQEAGVTSKDILVSTGKCFADSLSASAVGLPILLVKDQLNADQKEFLKDNTGKIYIIGGKNAVSEKIENQLKEFGSITRLSGETRYETSVLVAETFFADPTMAVIAYGDNFPDGLSGGPLAHAYGAPLLLTREGGEEAAEEYLKAHGVQSGYAMGGTAVLKDKTVKTVFSMTAEDKIAVK